MTVEGGGAAGGGLFGRVKRILLTPKTEWEVIDAEPATIQSLYVGYAVILAAIPAISSFIGGQVFGMGAFGVNYKPPLIGGLMTAVVSYVLSLVTVGLLGVVINALAPSFDGTKDTVKAFKVAIYSMTAAWVGGIFAIFPPLAILGFLAGLYGLYLLYLGLPRLMKAPESKALGYTAVTIIIAIVVNLLAALVIGAVTAPWLMASSMVGANAAGGTLTIPGKGSVDLGKLNAAAMDIERAADQMQVATAGRAVTVNAGAATSADGLQALLPVNLPGGFTRTEVSGGGMSGVAMGAEGVYQRGTSRVELNVVDMGAMGALGGLAGSVKSNRTTATGYEKMGEVNGRLTTEEYDRSANSGKYGVLVGNRFMVEAEGNGITVGDLKAAVEAVPFARLEAMAKG